MERSEAQIRTKAWIHYVAYRLEIDVSQLSLLQHYTGIIAQSWSYYKSGERNPGNETRSNTLRLVEQKVQGSSDIYKIGPENAPLWDALWSDEEVKLWSIAKSISKNVLFHEANINNLSGKYNCHDYPNFDIDLIDVYIEAVITYAQEALNLTIPTDNHHSHTESTLANSLSSSPAGTIYDFTALLAAYRLCHSRLPEEVEYQFSLRDCIEKLLDNSNTAKTLSLYGILDVITHIFFNSIPQPENSITMVPTIDLEILANVGDTVDIYIGDGILDSFVVTDPITVIHHGST